MTNIHSPNEKMRKCKNENQIQPILTKLTQLSTLFNGEPQVSVTRYSSGNNVAGGVDLVNQSRLEVTEELEGRLVKLHESNALTQAVKRVS
jgi:hypothetical protein